MKVEALKPAWRSALITGGSTGIGASLARRLVAEGSKVLVCARRTDLLESMEKELGPSFMFIKTDLSSSEQAADLVSQAVDRLGSLDLVIANAGFRINKPAAQLSPQDVLSVLHVNLLSACATLTASIPYMIGTGGHLVGISSIAGVRGMPNSAAYSTSKAGLSTFLESIRIDLRGTGINVTDIRPGFVATPLTQDNEFRMRFLLSADEAARLILRAVRRKRRVYTFPWQMAIGARLLRIAPNALFDKLASKS